MNLSLKSLNLGLLKNLPGLLEAQRLQNEERQSMRARLIAKIAAVRKQSEQREAELIAQAAPIEKRIKALRAELDELKGKLDSLADARLSTMYTSKQAVRDCQAELRADALDEIREIQNALDALRNLTNSNWRVALDSDLARYQLGLDPQKRTGDAMKRTLEAFNEADRIAIEEADVTAALERLRQDLLADGINLEAANGHPRV